MDLERRMQIIRSIIAYIPDDPNEKVDVALLAGIANCSVEELTTALSEAEKIVQHGGGFFTPHLEVPDYDTLDLFADSLGRGYLDTAAQHRHQPLDDESRWGND